MDPVQTAPLIWVHNVCHKRLFKHFSRRDKQTTFVAIGELRVKINFTKSYAYLNLVFTLTMHLGFFVQLSLTMMERDCTYRSMLYLFFIRKTVEGISLLLMTVSKFTYIYLKKIEVKIVNIFSPIIFNIVLGAQKNCLIEAVLLSIHNICFGSEILSYLETRIKSF